jgi:hypothetical protein
MLHYAHSWNAVAIYDESQQHDGDAYDHHLWRVDVTVVVATSVLKLWLNNGA